MSREPEQAFEAPWHGQVFALTVALSEAGHFAWTEWAAVFSAELEAQGQGRELDGSEDYYTAWVAALEEMLVAKGLAEAGLMTQMKALWTDAFLSTPHGEAVRIDA